MPPQGRRAHALCTAALVAVALASSCRAPARAAAPSPGGAPELEALCRSQQSAWNRGELETFMALGYWRSGELTFFSGGEWTRGYAPMLERFRTRYESGEGEMGELAFRELESARLGRDHGLVRGRWKLVFGDGQELGGLFTLLLRRFPEGWRIVHDHTSVDA